MPSTDDFEDFDNGTDETTDAEARLAAAEARLAVAEARLAAVQSRADEDIPDEEAQPAPAPRPNRAARRAAARAPKNRPAKQDQSVGREDEAVSDTLEFDFNGVTYTAPIVGRTRGLVSAMEDQSVRRILIAVIGQEQYENFLETDPYDSEYMELFRAWAQAAGFRTPGN
ncbi:MAG: hypothetical protein U5O16_03040 [Rhodococcus sp. (in: high G+C Gram-positive bacteria)]|uniref:hypothetical protein n=1 Tax=Rhodococcus sp. TaxID=1831 RepID=UPI002AD60811|nr:hypothetical protein [Rhodococcus sp. (in: high G+C Gram-positive bacteria)]